VPGINFVFAHAFACPECTVALAVAGARSTLTDETGALILFADSDPPLELTVSLKCPNGHTVTPPDDSSFEWWFSSPKDAPEGCVVVAVRGRTVSGRELFGPA
jgi:hypothetical protein